VIFFALARGEDHAPTTWAVVHVAGAPLDSPTLTVIEVLDLPRGEKMLL
jgi:predicted alpha/beta-hydrolase family hydrolase